MEATCQRCHEILREADLYCPACGLPQLTYVASEPPPLPVGEGVAVREGDHPTSIAGIAWRPALQAALILSIPAAVLSFSLLPIGLLWTVVAAGWAVNTYARRTRPVQLSTGTGARIGMVTGLFVGWLTVGLYGAGLWVSRFVLHQGGQWDALWQEQVEKSIERNQMVAQMGVANAQSAQIAQSLRAMMLSADWRAGLALSGLIVIAGFLVLFATIGGAMGARFFAPARRPGA